MHVSDYLKPGPDPELAVLSGADLGPVMERVLKGGSWALADMPPLPLAVFTSAELPRRKRGERPKTQPVWVIWPIQSTQDGGFLVLRERASRSELTVVLPDWSNEASGLRLSRAALRRAGIDPEKLESCLHAAAPSVSFRDPKRQTTRFLVSGDVQDLVVSSDSANDVEQRVGKVYAGRFPDDGSCSPRDIVVYVVLLPRLSPTPPPLSEPLRVSGNPVIALGDRDKAAAFLARTLLNTWKSDRLLAMLSLAHDVTFSVHEHDLPLPCSIDAQASSLGYLPFLRALEKASLDQRRAYHRFESEGRTMAGTLQTSAYFGNLASGRPDRVPTTRFLLSLDTPENRFFLGVADFVAARLRANGDGLSRWIAHRLDIVAQRFERVAPGVPEVVVADRLLGRPEIPDVQRTALERSRDVLTRRFATLDMADDEPLVGRGAELDLPSLFEASVRGFLAVALGLPVFGDQTAPRQEALRWRTHGGPPRLLPDIVVQGRGCVLAIGDAKYKRLIPSSGIDGMGQNASFWPLRREDFHQVMAYMLAWPEVRRGVVVYPEVEASTDTITGSCTRLVRELQIGEDRRVGVFAFAPERWEPPAVNEEIYNWMVSSDG